MERQTQHWTQQLTQPTIEIQFKPNLKFSENRATASDKALSHARGVFRSENRSAFRKPAFARRLLKLSDRKRPSKWKISILNNVFLNNLNKKTHHWKEEESRYLMHVLLFVFLFFFYIFHVYIKETKKTKISFKSYECANSHIRSNFLYLMLLLNPC
jgi:hypothetical protein